MTLPDGDYQIPNRDANGQMVETGGPAVQIGDVAASIQASTDPV